MNLLDDPLLRVIRSASPLTNGNILLSLVDLLAAFLPQAFGILSDRVDLLSSQKALTETC